ncbi:MAG TPA: DUF3618 domain-containing protein [Gemmatimonadales bacterium]|nr:DUF3618 domain-containing protein [Gemmatimonadales bacterium]
MTENPNRISTEGLVPTTPDVRDVDVAGEAGEKSPAEIEAEIEQTRQRMSENIEAIGQKLSPEHLKQQAKDALSDAGEAVTESMRGAASAVGERAREFGESAVEVIRRNPIPAAAVGIALAWLLMRTARGDRTEEARGFRDDLTGREPGHGPSYALSGSEPAAREAQGGGVREGASRVAGRTGELASQARERAGELASQARERVSRLGEATRHQARRAGEGARHLMDQNPMVVGAAALCLGAAIGLLLPASRREDRLVGRARDRVVDRVQETAREVKEVATEAARHARDTARREIDANRETVRTGARDLMDTIKGAANRVATETKETARREAERRHLTRSEPPELGAGPGGV